jgi:HAMP domain-containing protein
MNLFVKFSLVFVLVFTLALLIAGKLCHDFLRQGARDQVLAQAKLMIQSAAATRTYTEKQIQPLLGVHRSTEFHPQWVPFYAAAETFKYLRIDYPDYAYKEAALNPTNPRDRAVEWEADVINYFRDHPEQTEFSGERDAMLGRSLYFAHPVVAETGCLACHSTAAVAPPAMVRLYGQDNGFGWKLNEIVGAQIVSVPMSVPLGIADSAFRSLLGSFVGVGILTLIALNLVLAIIVIRPVSRAAASADEISKGNVDVPELPVRGKDEIAIFAEAFNRMHRSLARAMHLLERGK